MKLGELIEKLIDLQAQHGDSMEVGYLNDCADNGHHFIEAGEVNVRRKGHYHGDYPTFPACGVVVLD